MRLGFLRLLGDVDRVLEADQRVEGERGAGEHRRQHAAALLELERARPGPRRRRPIATTAIRTIRSRPPISTIVSPTLSFTDSEMPRRLISVIRASSASAASTTLIVDELAQVVAAEAARERAGRGDPGGDHGEGDDERDEVALEGAVNVKRRAAGPRVLRDELRVGAGREGGHHQGEQEGRPDRATGLGADLADQRVDAAAEDVADDEHEQQCRRDRAAQPPLVLRLPVLRSHVSLRYPPAPTGTRSRRRSATALRVSANSAAISP